MHTAYIGIGSNLGNREEHCNEAIQRMAERGIGITARSSMHETEPWGVRDQPNFINMAVQVRTDLEPRALLDRLKAIERDMGRTGGTHWGPRIIDLDILLYEERAINEPGLTIPHPNLHERDFVLRPLAEIAPALVHPILKKTIQELLKRVQGI